jgi:hypothetical protein
MYQARELRTKRSALDFDLRASSDAACSASTGKSLVPGEKYRLECFSDCVRRKETAPNEKAA